MKRRIIRPDELRARTAQLDELRCQRPLTPDEQAEADNLAARAHMRAWRAVQADRERAIMRGAAR